MRTSYTREEARRLIPVTWTPEGFLDGAVIVGRDGCYVRRFKSYDAWALSAGHVDVVGGMAFEWAENDDAADVRRRARRMLAAVRRELAAS